MGNLFAGPHLWIILIIILLLFGAAKLPALAKSLGQSARVFKGEMKAMKEDDADATTPDAADATATGTSAPAKPSAERPADQDTPPRAS
ncbi:twin-arginine translocase TatA/TatE family subunit [Microbacterium esteraromaticum]|uniref:Sec-independent protein translocase protein TatA n=1 Tax=Microbacterium esteraromaticum TaxID=57043 RepID=A0A939DXY2_9MICO|nr:twin-arginine translocase TatA/TatE family subunit [Microbacterium esteraromaticum]MBN7792635.1 twin-arginine translocase TatA/TatE family subunit [Microbacterium esteraromaticum]MBN8206098.1 twin-arginine translocase TatA/TatE family subunit [Microbacterium esteraromaticum]MBN8416253.1 twin-arginine translocase TatA/TatE family subunit [Microbacterium esteraromaticum]MBN8423391.1 twin-arginine translocase TatA/TatE family subunit [Microbacterium esteraromaticum]MCA1306257.1 twin-arginine t